MYRRPTVAVGRSSTPGLIGLSGSGKTTLLNVISGWETPDAGSVRWTDGESVGSSPAWVNVSVLSQKLGLLDELTVRENVEYPARLAGKLAGLTDTVDDLVDELHLTSLRNRYLQETSVGEQQRTALARAAVMSPRVLLVTSRRATRTNDPRLP